MPAKSPTPLGKALARVGRAAAFVALTVALTTGALAASTRVTIGRYSLFQSFTGNYLEPGGRYQSLRRFREADASGPVDVVFFGSSHAYRGFDPRLFAAAGVSSLNLGSTNQTPLNSYYLEERYLVRLAPKLVVFEVYYQSLASDGLESCRDLAINTPASWSSTKMAIATWNFGAMSFAVASDLHFAGGAARASQADVEGERYIQGGYVESSGHREGLLAGDMFTFELRDEQLLWLERASAYARDHGAKVVWVTHPLPDDHRRRLANRAALHASITRAAERAGVPYFDFDATMTLDPVADFADFHHLSASGVAKFDAALIDRLRASQLLSATRPDR